MSEPAFQTDDTLGDYRIIRMIGRGGMGTVYEVEHTRLEKRYAIKVLREEVARSANGRERFSAEAREMAHFEHPGILDVDDTHAQKDGTFWLRMPLMNGIEGHDGERWVTLGRSDAGGETGS